ncbi:MAG: hypothetical protein PHE52_02525 [Candidatus Pacebacteria bacterium]|nr:hypothetical protein [Candidatus Paceibacterota bacterium]
MKNIIKPAFKLGMAAVEVVIEIAKSAPEISSVFFAVYTPATLKDFVSDRIERHNPPDEIIKVKREDIVKGDPHYFFQPLIDWPLANGKRHLAISSEIKLQGDKKSFHIPLVDFKCENTPENLERVRNFLTKIGQKTGVILNSGRSYHYYGLDILSKDEWRVFMAKCLLSDLADLKLLDVHYIGHSLWDGYSILRISSSSRYPRIPSVVSIL